jgi:hypothetical protein
MKLVFDGLDVSGDFLTDHCPDNLEFFSLWVTATVGPLEGGRDLYTIHVCTPDWIKFSIHNSSQEPSFWGRHTLIVNEFDHKIIESAVKNKIQEILKNSPDDNGMELLKKFGRYAHWEFEDYIPYKKSTGVNGVEVN